MSGKDRTYLKRTKVPQNPLDPYFYHVFEHTLPREYHYRMVPAFKDLVTHAAVDFKQKGYRRRFIFGAGWDNYTDFEKESIATIKRMV